MIDFNNMYFHGLSGNINTIGNDEYIIDNCINQLEQIILTGGLYSRNKLKDFNISYDHKPVENGNDYISLCVCNPKDEEFEGINEGFDSSFNTYVLRNRISLIISDEINKTHTFRDPSESFFLPGERQVRDSISFENIIGIMVSFQREDMQDLATSKVKELLTKHNVYTSLFNGKFEEITSNYGFKK